MNEIVSEWISKAERDFETAERESLVGVNANFDAICYHYQQCIEKLMKGIIVGLGENPPKTHNLEVLSRIIATHVPNWHASANDLRLLTHAASDFRYPGETASQSIADRSSEVAKYYRTALLEQIKLIDEL